MTYLYKKLVNLFVKAHRHYFKANVSETNIHRRNANKLHRPQYTLTFNKNIVYYICIKLYNMLQNDAKVISRNYYKYKLQDWLLHKCFIK